MTRRSMPAAAWFYGQGFHRDPPTPAQPSPVVVYFDTRPRCDYRLPDSTVVKLILDHNERPPATITVALKGGTIVTATLVEGAS